VKHAANRILHYYFDVLKVYVENLFLPSKFTYEWYCGHVNLLFRFLPQGEIIVESLKMILQQHQVYPLYYCLQCAIDKLEKYDMVGVSNLREEFWKRVENIVKDMEQREKIKSVLKQLEENDYNFSLDDQLALLGQLRSIIPLSSQSRFYSDVYFLFRIKYAEITSPHHQHIFAYGKTLVQAHPEYQKKLDEYDGVISITVLPSSAVPELIPCPTSVDKPRPKRSSLPSTSAPAAATVTTPPLPTTSSPSINIIPPPALPLQMPPTLPTPQPNEPSPTFTESTSDSSKDSRKSSGSDAFQKWCQVHVIDYSDRKLEEMTQIIKEINTCIAIIDELKGTDQYNCLKLFEKKWEKLQEYIYPEFITELYQLLATSLRKFHKVARFLAQLSSLPMNHATPSTSTNPISISQQLPPPPPPPAQEMYQNQQFNTAFRPLLPPVPQPNYSFPPPQQFSPHNQQITPQSNYVFQNPYSSQSSFQMFSANQGLTLQQRPPPPPPPPPTNPPLQRPPPPPTAAPTTATYRPIKLEQVVSQVFADLNLPLNSADFVAVTELLTSCNNRKITTSMVMRYARQYNVEPDRLIAIIKRLHQLLNPPTMSNPPSNLNKSSLRNSSLSIVQPSPILKSGQSKRKPAFIDLVNEEANTNQVTDQKILSSELLNNTKVGENEVNGENDDDSLVSEEEEDLLPSLTSNDVVSIGNEEAGPEIRLSEMSSIILPEERTIVTNGKVLEEIKDVEVSVNFEKDERPETIGMPEANIVSKEEKNAHPTHEIPLLISTESSKTDNGKNGASGKALELQLPSTSNGIGSEDVGQSASKEKEEPLKTSPNDEISTNLVKIIIEDLTRDGQIFKYAVTKEVWNTARLSKIIKKYFDRVKENDPSKYDFVYNNMVIQPEELHKRAKEFGLKDGDIIILREKEV